MMKRNNRKGFTLVEVLVAILIISVASAALAASVNSASDMNATGLKIDSEYKENLAEANGITENVGSGQVSFSESGDAENADSTHSVAVFGSGDLSTASGSVGTVEGEATGENVDGSYMGKSEKDIGNYKIGEADGTAYGSAIGWLSRGDVVRTFKGMLPIVKQVLEKVFDFDFDRNYYLAMDDTFMPDDNFIQLWSSTVEWVRENWFGQDRKIIDITESVNDTTGRYKISSVDFQKKVENNKSLEDGQKAAVFEEGTIVYINGNYYYCFKTHEACDLDYLWVSDNDSQASKWVKLNVKDLTASVA